MGKKPQTEAWFQQLMDQELPKKRLGRNCLVAFLSGGLLCAAAQLAEILILVNSEIPQETADSIVLICVIALVALLTGLGVYDKLGQKLGAGLAVPISGFANSVSASMLEHRSEGMVLGSGCNSFKLAGAVVVFGIASAFFVTLIALIFNAV